MNKKRIDRETWRRWLLYVDIIVFGLLVISIILLMSDAFAAGYDTGWNGQYIGIYTSEIVRDIVFIIATLFWIFYRFFKNELAVLKEEW